MACGVRKMWYVYLGPSWSQRSSYDFFAPRSKELKDCETPTRQIAHIRKILSELGMSGRMSLEQAKAIREKRELAQEISTFTSACNLHLSDLCLQTGDVIAFDQEKGLAASSRASRLKQSKVPTTKRKAVVDSDSEEGSDEEEEVGKKPRVC